MAWLGARRTAHALALAALCWTGLAGGLTTAAWAAEDAEDAKEADTKSRGGQVLKTGWWWVANQPPAETGLVAYPQQSPPNIPAGHLPVAASAGEPDKVTAVELVLDAKPGASVTTAKVVLTESDAAGATVNAEAAKIIACPVTDGFWADGTAARWDARPAYDCDAAQAAGTRDDKGRWTFDLTGLASSWLAEGATGSPSFALVEAVDAPESFQVTFAPVAENGIVYTGKYGAPVGGGTAPITGPTSSTGGVAVGGGAAGGGFGAGDSGSTGSLTTGSLDAGTSGDVPLDAAPAEQGATAETTDPVTAQTTPVAAPAIVPSWYSGMPKAAFLLVPFALGLAYLAMLALGPDAQPTTTTSRHGVSRALDRLRQAGTQALAGVRR
jgi:hypothetical protein